MIRKMGYTWELRKMMADRGMFQTSDLAGPLAERGVTMSREQLWRLVSQQPQRLSLEVLAAACDILQCEPGDLIKVKVENATVRKTGTGPAGVAPAPRRTTVRRPTAGP